MEGRAHLGELQPGDVHGVEGVDEEDVEAATSVHQHLGEALFVDDGVDDEWIASWSDYMGWMVPLIKSDRRFQPVNEGGDDCFSDTRLSVAHFVLALGVDSIGSPKDYDAFLGVRKAVAILAHRASFLGCCLLALSFFRPIGQLQEALEELVVLVEVLDGIGVVGVGAIHELVEVVR